MATLTPDDAKSHARPVSAIGPRSHSPLKRLSTPAPHQTFTPPPVLHSTGTDYSNLHPANGGLAEKEVEYDWEDIDTASDYSDSKYGIKPENGDVEAQRRLLRMGGNVNDLVVAEYQVSTRTKLLHLSGWFALNLSLTLFNKQILGDFHFPWILTFIHTTTSSVGCFGLLLNGYFRLTALSSHSVAVLLSYSVLFTLNIAISNVSLDYVSVPFHQIMRSTTPVFTVLIHRIYYGRIYGTMTYSSLVPVIIGVALATYGDYYFTPLGFILTLAGAVLASLKTVVTNRLLTGSLALPPLELLLRMSPLAAFQSLFFSYTSGESARFVQYAIEGGLTRRKVFALTVNGVIAFLLNVSSFGTNKLAGALTLTVAGNLKQCLTILLGVVVFQVKVTGLNGLGMLISLLGAAWYSIVELDSKGRR